MERHWIISAYGEALDYICLWSGTGLYLPMEGMRVMGVCVWWLWGGDGGGTGVVLLAPHVAASIEFVNRLSLNGCLSLSRRPCSSMAALRRLRNCRHYYYYYYFYYYY